MENEISKSVDCCIAFDDFKSGSAEIIDVRSYEEVEVLGNIPNARHVPWYIWEEMFGFKLTQCAEETVPDMLKEEKLHELKLLLQEHAKTDKKVYILCASGRRTTMIAKEMAEFSEGIFSVEDGLTGWCEHELPFVAVD